MINWFRIALRLKGIPIGKAEKFYRKVRHEYRQNPAAFRAKKLQEVVDYHKTNNTLFAKISVGKSHANELPVVSKQTFQGEKALTEIYKNSHYSSKTSGSSGVPLFYYKDKFTHALTWAEIITLYKEHGIKYGSDLQARFYAIPLEGLKYYIERFKDFLSARYRFIIHDMADTKLEQFVEVFKQKRFKYIYGYTNALVLFARYLIRKGIIIKQVCPSVKLCVVTSEVCSAEDRILLQEGFGVEVVNEYGASEIGLIAFEDQNFNWRISNELIDVEILDDNNQPVPEGQVGKIVVTSYFNKAMPFIRYEVGDWGSVWRDEQGVMYLKQLYGRLNDVLKLSDGKIVPGFTLYYVTKAMMEKLPGMREYNIRQTGLEEITFDLVLEREIDDKQRQEIEKIVRQYLSSDFNVVFRRVDKIERLPSGKMKHFHALS